MSHTHTHKYIYIYRRECAYFASSKLSLNINLLFTNILFILNMNVLYIDWYVIMYAIKKTLTFEDNSGYRILNLV